ncbi:NUDIX hydrolase [Penaeicola halotolerans]|uniref:NUDIX hydrolase n=1 Tax=Penaeicola halotolerans TaxID=2793196 RepID=UPI001CF7FE24|nr:NUDIX hydrolase [Penaeicola halotolerans]
MSRASLIHSLQNYQTQFLEEEVFRLRFLEFISRHTDCFHRSCVPGHLTASAWIVSKDRQQVLLTHHRKLERWLQLGGHADGVEDLSQVATQEAIEESGLSQVRLLSADIYDLDIHAIPARKQDPLHLHYDVRFLFEADAAMSLEVSEESLELAWVPLTDLSELVGKDASFYRMVDKLKNY